MIFKQTTVPGNGQPPLNLNAYLPEGQPLTRVVLAVHGFGEYGSRYRNWAERFTERGCAFYAHDQRGHGLTEGPRGYVENFDVFLADLDAVLARIRTEHPGIPIILYGHSMGGNIALRYLMTRPEGADLAVVSSPWLKLRKDTPLFLVKLLERILGPEFALQIKLDTLSSDKAYLKEISSEGLYHTRISVAMAKGVMESGLFILGHPHLLAVPTLLMSAGSDRIVDLKSISRLAASGNPAIEVLNWESFHHELHNEKGRSEVFDAVWSYIEGRCPVQTG